MFKYHISQGVLQGDVIQITSPNCNERKVLKEKSAPNIDLLVIHNISLPPNKFGGGYVEQFFQNKLNAEEDPFFQEIAHLQVSAHLFISRLGEVTQFVNFDDRAWHAGVSCFKGKDSCNDFSIGIELEGSDFCKFSAAQYDALSGVSVAIEKYYPDITSNTTVGHSDIAPGRKTDPGPFFDWDLYRKKWQEQSNS